VFASGRAVASAQVIAKLSRWPLVQGETAPLPMQQEKGNPVTWRTPFMSAGLKSALMDGSRLWSTENEAFVYDRKLKPEQYEIDQFRSEHRPSKYDGLVQ